MSELRLVPATDSSILEELRSRAQTLFEARSTLKRRLEGGTVAATIEEVVRRTVLDFLAADGTGLDGLKSELAVFIDIDDTADWASYYSDRLGSVLERNDIWTLGMSSAWVAQQLKRNPAIVRESQRRAVRQGVPVVRRRRRRA